jgi:hypothetical protein
MKWIISAVILISTIILCTITYMRQREIRIMKEDLVELSKVKYGLFSVDEWKKILAALITKKVEELEITPSNRGEMEKKISGFLYKAIDNFEQVFYQKNSGDFKGLLKNLLVSNLKGFDEIRAYVPEMTRQVMAFVDDPANRDRVKGFMIEKLNQYADQTFSEIDYTTHDEVVTRHGMADRESTIALLRSKIGVIEMEARPYSIAILVIVALTFFWILLDRRPEKYQVLLFVCLCITLLLFGVSLPMIEIDARISTMKFSLLGESIAFNDQVLYYKSKSILEVVRLMLQQGRTDVIFVGILVLTFSVLFPVSKLVATVIIAVSPRSPSNKTLRFLAFSTGKWSMADVMVVAIFMSYIGFSGIITEQLRQLEDIARNVDVLTTNRSSLQVGFFLFTSFTLLSLAVSHRLNQSRQVVDTGITPGSLPA